MINYLYKFNQKENITSKEFDFSETVNITSLALIKIIRHAQMGIPLEVMGIMLGKFVDKFNIEINDVFAMPQTGTKVSVEAVDPIFQTKMLDMLMQIEKYNIIVGWYHSHPGFGCWLSGVDINTQKSFEQLNRRSIALVVDPVQSTKGNMIIEIFRLKSLSEQKFETRDLSSLESNSRFLPNFDDQNGINKSYYSLKIGLKKNPIEEIVLTKLFEKAWNMNFFLSHKGIPFSSTKIKIILKILKNFVKIIKAPSIFSNNWLKKNFLKIKKIRSEIRNFYDCISKKTVYSCLIQLFKEILVINKKN